MTNRQAAKEQLVETATEVFNECGQIEMRADRNTPRLRAKSGDLQFISMFAAVFGLKVYANTDQPDLYPAWTVSAEGAGKVRMLIKEMWPYLSKEHKVTASQMGMRA